MLHPTPEVLSLFYSDPSEFKKQLVDGMQSLPESFSLVPISIVDSKPSKSPKKTKWQATDFSRESIAAEIYSGKASGVGLKTGLPSGGILALDIDGTAAQALLDSIMGSTPMPKTVSFTSGKPGCRQMLFQLLPFTQTDKVNKTKSVLSKDGTKSEDLDFRWTSCQSVLPPSAHPTQPQYRWVEGCSPSEVKVARIPQVLLEYWEELITPTVAIIKSKTGKTNSTKTGFDFHMSKSFKELSQCKEGGRNNLLNKAGFTLAKNYPECGDIIIAKLTEAGLKAGMDSNELSSTLSSAVESGVAAYESEPDVVPHTGGNPTLLSMLADIKSRRWSVRLNIKSGDIEVNGKPIDPNKVKITTAKALGYCLSADSDNTQVWLDYAEEDAYNPVAEYLYAIPKTTKKIDLWNIPKNYFGNSSWFANQAFGRKLIASVARTMQPGCKEDSILALFGKQGGGKSSTLAILGGEWHTDSLHDLSNKDHVLLMTQRWIVELAEFGQYLTKAGNDKIKAFSGSSRDSMRVAYGRGNKTYDRSATMWATVNSSEILNDPTGSRRMWMVEVFNLDRQKLTEDRDAIWLAALEAYEAGEQWMLTEEEDEARKAVAHLYQQEDPWLEALDLGSLVTEQAGEWVVSQSRLYEKLSIPASGQSNMTNNRLKSLMEFAGFTKKQKKIAGQVLRVWASPTKP
jgi:hypothetical protein